MLPSPVILGPVYGVSELFLTLVKRSKSNAVSHDRNSLRLIWLVNLVSITIGVFAARDLPAWVLPWRKEIYIAGCAVFASGLILRWYSIILLGRFFTVNVAIAADHKLIMTGSYRYIRHPSYTGSLSMVLGFSLCLGNLASLLIIFVPVVCVSLWRIRIEEAALLQAFGDQYRAYLRRTKRLLPFVY